MEVLSPGPGKELEFEPIEIPELNNNGSDPQSEDKVKWKFTQLNGVRFIFKTFIRLRYDRLFL